MPPSSGELGEAPWGCQGALGDLLGLSSAALGHLLEVFHVILGFSERPQGFPGCLLGAIGCLREKIIQMWMQDRAKNRPKLEIVCSDKT